MEVIFLVVSTTSRFPQGQCLLTEFLCVWGLYFFATPQLVVKLDTYNGQLWKSQATLWIRLLQSRVCCRCLLSDLRRILPGLNSSCSATEVSAQLS